MPGSNDPCRKRGWPRLLAARPALPLQHAEFDLRLRGKRTEPRAVDAGTAGRSAAPLAQHADQQEIPLERELTFVDRYIQLQLVRFADRLQVKVHADPDAMTAAVPPSCCSRSSRTRSATARRNSPPPGHRAVGVAQRRASSRPGARQRARAAARLLTRPARRDWPGQHACSSRTALQKR